MAMATTPNLLVASFIIFSIIHGNAHSMSHKNNDDKKVYIVYMGAKPHNNHDLIAQSHYDVLTNVLGSEEEAKKSMIYTYKYSFSGFSAMLTKPQADKIAGIPGVVKVMQNKQYLKPLNTRSWDYMGLSVHSPNNNLLHKTNMGDGIIIGVIDSGIWPSKAFNDKDHGPIPSKWKGICKSELRFNATQMCNKKVIGARWFRDAFNNEYGNPRFIEEASPLDDKDGHGTHVASTAAGSFVDNVKYWDINFGTFRGGAPRAKLAIYKVCWSGEQKIGPGVNDTHLVQACSAGDILSAFDQAIRDGVDIISVSIGAPVPLLPSIDESNGYEIGSFHASMHGIPVVYAAGNDGPEPMTLSNVAPWDINVVASTIDRVFSVLITLGNNKTIMGEGLFSGNEIDFTGFIVVPRLVKRDEPTAESILPDDGSVKGRVMVVLMDNPNLIAALVNRTAILGGVALILATPPNFNINSRFNDKRSDTKVKVPCIKISNADANSIFDLFNLNPSGAILKVSTTRILLGKEIQTEIATFSSRGPNPRVPSILKPDIAAPGVQIIGAASEGNEDGEFTIMSGTSMAAPHVTGVIALLKQAHPKWSPAALRSAITTTAWNHDSQGFPVYAEGSSLATPFDYGSGIINPNAANEPGLVYDMGTTDYIHYMCALGYSTDSIYRMTVIGESTANNGFDENNMCPNRELSIFNLNVPSITIADLRKSMTLTRTVTNVGPVDSTYKAIIEAPVGTTISVKPEVLKFDSKITTVSFEVSISSTQTSTHFNFGSLTWTDTKHIVRIPISVKTVLSQ